jgi:hypothetical protein
VGRDSVVGIANRYGMDGPGIETRWGPDFLYPTSLLFSGYRVFVGVKWPGCGVDHPFPSSAEIKGSVLYGRGLMASTRANITEAILPMNI